MLTSVQFFQGCDVAFQVHTQLGQILDYVAQCETCEGATANCYSQAGPSGTDRQRRWQQCVLEPLIFVHQCVVMM